MVFTEFSYAFFLLIGLAAFYIVSKQHRAYPLIATGILFYWYFAGDFLFVLLIQTALFYFALRHIRNNAVFWIVLSSVTAVLAYFKYRLLIADALGAVLPFHAASSLPGQIVAPLAISFFTFEFIHYWIDTKHGRITSHSFPKFLTFIFFFPTMFAGPIKRYEPFIPQLETAQASAKGMSAGLFRILLGFFKKVVIADSLSEWVTVLSTRHDAALVSPFILWLAVLAYAVKIYMDFSGYSDIAIGSSRLFGLAVPENFSNPYLKRNISLFWKSWHMSLTSWIWDYIFMPLAAALRNIASPRFIVLVIALSSFITLTIVGLWHGAEAHFILWGSYHGVLLAGYAFYSKLLKPHLAKHQWYHSRPAEVIAIGITFFFVLLSWPLFATDAPTALFILRRMFFLA